MDLPRIGVTLPAPRQRETARQRRARLAYFRALEQAGARPVPLRPEADPACLAKAARSLDGLLLTGGGDVHPRFYGAEPGDLLREVDEVRDAAELALVRWAAEAGRPLLAICRGLQVVNVALGGTLYQDLPSERPSEVRHDDTEVAPGRLAHDLRLAPQGPLAAWFPGPPRVNSYHHQAVRDLAEGLRPLAWAPDAVLEALDLPDHPFLLGVQWHPERLPDRPETQALFRALVQAALA